MSDYFLADDLSGALDAAGAFHRAGRRVRIVLAAEAWPRAGDDDVVAFTTETRNAPPLVAAAAVTRAIAQGRERGAHLVYKKIDSTLRGPVAAELAALAAALPEVRILFAPANPAMGRTVRDGVLLVHGVPVAETEFARDPASPIQESVIGRLLGDVAAGRINIPDALTADDLAAAVQQMDSAGAPWVGVGSGALARPVAARISVDAGEEAPAGKRTSSIPAPERRPGFPLAGNPAAPHPLPAGPCLMVCGSAHVLNRAQATVLATERGVRVHALQVDLSGLAREAAQADLRAGRGSAIVIEDARRDSVEVIAAVVATVGQIMTETTVRRVFVTGGETAFALCRALQISTLAFGEEIEPGLSLSRGENAQGAILFAIKPGGFGDRHTWVRAWDALAST